jgi:hypothetical protein
MRCISWAPTTRTERRSCSPPEKAGKTPEEFVAEIAKGRPQYLKGFHIEFDNWHSTHSPENTELSQGIYRQLKAKGLIYTKPVEQFYDPVKKMFLADRYIKGECPVCGTKDQYGDACEELQLGLRADRAAQPLFDPLRSKAGAAHFGAPLLPPLGPRMPEVPRGLDRCQRQAATAGPEQSEGMARR